MLHASDGADEVHKMVLARRELKRLGPAGAGPSQLA